jgi:tetratricopeptide (TPR) repeat protein
MPKVFVYNNPKRRIPKSAVYALGGLLIVALIAWGVFAVLNERQKSKDSAQRLNAALGEAQKAQAVGANAKVIDKSLPQLVAAIPAAKTNKQKVQLYYDLALAYESNGNPQEAIHYMLLCDQLDPSSAAENDLFLAEAYQQLGENTQAIAAYKSDISRVRHDSQLSSWSKNYEIENDNGIIQSLETNQ